jgi:hypothetical protein
MQINGAAPGHDILKRSASRPDMSRMDVISIESRSGRSSVPEWTDALSTRVGQLPLSSCDQSRQWDS